MPAGMNMYLEKVACYKRCSGRGANRDSLITRVVCVWPEIAPIWRWPGAIRSDASYKFIAMCHSCICLEFYLSSSSRTRRP